MFYSIGRAQGFGFGRVGLPRKCPGENWGGGGRVGEWEGEGVVCLPGKWPKYFVGTTCQCVEQVGEQDRIDLSEGWRKI